MAEPEAFVNGRFVPQSAAVLPVYDAGFVQGTTVAEQMRTFGGNLFRLQAHLNRLQHSLQIVEVDPGYSLPELADAATQLVRRNYRLLERGDDLGLAMFVTPGAYAAMAPPGRHRPLVCLHTFPLSFEMWADKYRGEALVTTAVGQVPMHCWPPELKCRSRMHYYLAERAARQIDPGARPAMLDEQGFVTESTTSNIVIYRAGSGLVIPPREKILPGISLAVLLELAAAAGLDCREEDLRPADVAAADEVFLCSTSPCMLPVIRFNRQPIGRGEPGPRYEQLMGLWEQLVGVDIRAQAQRFKQRAAPPTVSGPAE